MFISNEDAPTRLVAVQVSARNILGNIFYSTALFTTLLSFGHISYIDAYFSYKALIRVICCISSCSKLQKSEVISYERKE